LDRRVVLLAAARWAFNRESMAMKFRCAVLSLLAVSCAATALWAQAEPAAETTRPADESAADQAEPQPTIRVYKVGDLFTSPPNHRASYHSDLTQGRSGAYGDDAPKLIFPSAADDEAKRDEAAAGAGFNVREDTPLAPDDATEEFVGLVQSMIAPQSWYSAGGPNHIEQLGTSLVVSADEKTHAQIQQLVAKLRESLEGTPTVSVRGYWLWLSDVQLGELLADGPTKNGEPRDAGRAFGLVRRDAFEKHLSSLKTDDGGRGGGYRAAITCFDRQTVHLASGRQSLVTSGYIPVVGDGTNVAFRPVHSIVKEGPVLEITPRLAALGNEVVLDVRSRVAVRDGATENPDARKLGDEPLYVGARRMAAMIEGRALRVHELATTIRVPLDKPMLVGGMTYGEEPKPGEPNLYLFVDVAVQRPAADKKSAK
jgi:hypothetical protein